MSAHHPLGEAAPPAEVAQRGQAPPAGPRLQPSSDRWPAALAALAFPDYRHLWLATLGTGAGWWMDTVSRGWLVYQLTGSATQLGLASAVRVLPYLICAPLAGIAADRWDRQRQLQLSQAAGLLTNLVLALLVASGRIELWHVYATAVVAGVSQAFMHPARQALLPTLVPRQTLMNAIAISSGAFSVTKTVGPALAGVLVGTAGVAATCLVQAVLYLWAIVQLTRLHAPPQLRRAVHGSVLADLRAGLVFVRGDAAISALLLLALVPAVLAQPYFFLLPIIADRVLEVGAFGLGLLAASPGVGAVGAAVALAAVGDVRRKGTLMLGAAAGFGVLLVLFAESRWLPLSCALLVLVGATQTSYNALNQTLLQTLTPDGFRGRVQSLLLLDRGMVPLGAASIGVLGDLLGAATAVLIMGALCAAIAVAVAMRVPRLRYLE